MSERYGNGAGGGRGKGCGTGQGRKRGSGRGMDHGMGRGLRMGQGQGRGMGQGMGPTYSFSPLPEMRGQEGEVHRLRAQAEDVANRLRAINQRISEFERMSAVRPVTEESGSEQKRKAREREVRLTAVVDGERCVCCGLCVDCCPRQAISLNHELAIDSSRCDGCGSCVDVCPNEAVSLSGAVALDSI